MLVPHYQTKPYVLDFHPHELLYPEADSTLNLMTRIRKPYIKELSIRNPIESMESPQEDPSDKRFNPL